MNTLRALAILSACLTVVAGAEPAPPPTPAATAAPAPAKPKQWLYVLRLVPRLHDDNAWTDGDKRAVGDHFRRLKQLTEDGVVILAGRTNEPGDRTMGLVVFEAPDEAAARAIMDGEPTLKAGVMTATLHPYSVALLRTTPSGTPPAKP